MVSKKNQQQIKDRWATLEKVYSSKERIERIGYSIIDDMNTIGRHDYFEERKEKYSIVSKDELEELLVDNPWMRTTINDEKEDDSWMITYTADGKRITYGTWVNDEYKKIEHEENEYSIDDDGQLIEANEGTYQIRKIEDDIVQKKKFISSNRKKYK